VVVVVVVMITIVVAEEVLPSWRDDVTEYWDLSQGHGVIVWAPSLGYVCGGEELPVVDGGDDDWLGPLGKREQEGAEVD
jgi:hypothetical protein